MDSQRQKKVHDIINIMDKDKGKSTQTCKRLNTVFLIAFTGLCLPSFGRIAKSSIFMRILCCSEAT